MLERRRRFLPLAVLLHQAMAAKEMRLAQTQTMKMRLAALLSVILLGYLRGSVMAQ